MQNYRGSSIVNTSAECNRRSFLASTVGAAVWSVGLQVEAVQPVAPKARRALMIYLPGGPSQLDLWDPKPSASSDVRSPFDAISTAIPGLAFSSLFPRLARQTHRLAVVRSLYHDDVPTHEASQRLLWPNSSELRQPLEHHGSVNARDRKLYGASEFSRQFVLARNLLERGSALVGLSAGNSHQRPNWDCHAQSHTHTSSLADYQRTLGPALDQALSGLLEDLAQRGMLAETLICVSGEMGRTPRLNRAGGRDHWTHCWTGLFAGAGITGGALVGRSDAQAAHPVDDPMHSRRISATLDYALGYRSEIAPIEQLWS